MRHFSQEILPETVMSLLKKQVCFYLINTLSQDTFLFFPLAVRKLTAKFVINEQDPIPAPPCFPSLICASSKLLPLVVSFVVVSGLWGWFVLMSISSLVTIKRSKRSPLGSQLCPFLASLSRVSVSQSVKRRKQ